MSRPDVVGGLVAAIHTFGALVHWHPHLAPEPQGGPIIRRLRLGGLLSSYYREAA